MWEEKMLARSENNQVSILPVLASGYQVPFTMYAGRTPGITGTRRKTTSGLVNASMDGAYGSRPLVNAYQKEQEIFQIIVDDYIKAIEDQLAAEKEDKESQNMAARQVLLIRNKMNESRVRNTIFFELYA